MRRLPVVFLACCLLAGCEGQAKLPCQDTLSDPQNCGACGNACPAPTHAAAVCVEGACGRADCDAGWLDLQAEVEGCETEATGVPSSGLVWAVPSSSTSLLQHAQTGPAHRNEAVLAEPTPAPLGGVVEQTDGQYRNQPGFNSLFE